MELLSKDISVNNFKYINNYEPRLKVFLEGKELKNFCTGVKIDEGFDYFVMAKFFLFIVLNPMRGLKIIGREKHNKRLKDIISIQKLLFRENYSFDCEEDILDIEIKKKDTTDKKIFYGYISHTDIHADCLENFNVKDVANTIIKIFRENNIDRRNLGGEMKKRQNYILSRDGLPKLIDIDPYFYYVE